jgi:hypothetical protein
MSESVGFYDSADSAIQKIQRSIGFSDSENACQRHTRPRVAKNIVKMTKGDWLAKTLEEKQKKQKKQKKQSQRDYGWKGQS